MRITTSLGVTALALALAACKQDDQTTAPGVSADASPGVGEAAEDDENPDQARVTLDPRIAKMCGIDEPTFDFDSVKLSKATRGTLDQLVSCFVEGAAKGHNMNLVGHADPRGSEDYNFALGQRRAGSVGGYLAKKGLGDDRVATSSRGELDATGTTEKTWRDDRRVEILLAE